MNRGIRTHVPALWAVAISGWVIHLRAGGLRKDTLSTHQQRLERTARHIGVADPWQVTGDVLLHYFGTQVAWEPETRRGHRSSLRGFYGWAVTRGHVVASPALVLPRVKPSDPNPMPAPDSVYLPALAAADCRETLMLELAAEHGLRRGEVVRVNTETDLVEDLIGWSLQVHGKGGKDRTVPLLEDVAATLRALPRGWAFPGRIDGHLSPRRCGELINQLLPAGWTIHKLRHRAATQWWEASEHDLLLVSGLLGHSSTAITQRYVKAAQTREREVMARAKAAAEERRRSRFPVVSELEPKRHALGDADRAPAA